MNTGAKTSLGISPLLPLAVIAAALFGFAGRFLCLLVLLLFHETGHMAAASILSISIRSIRITPFGGVIELAAEDELPQEELLIAAAGPAVNIIIAAAADIPARFGFHTDFLHRIAGDSLALALFNLFPALPLDGGRMLHGILTPHTGPSRAFAVPAYIGIAAGVSALGFGIYYMLCGVFIPALVVMPAFMALSSLRALVSRRGLPSYGLESRVRLLRGERLPVHGAALNCGVSLRSAAACAVPGRYNIFYVLGYDGGLIAVVTERQLILGMRRFGAHAPLSVLCGGTVQKRSVMVKYTQNV